MSTVKDEVIAVDTDDQEGLLAYVPSQPLSVNDRQTVVIHFPSVEIASAPEEFADDVQAAVTAVIDGEGASWYGWSADGWMKLTGAVPPTSGGCDVRFLFSNDVHKVSYAVNTGSGWTVLKPEGAASEWLPNGVPSAASVGNVTFAGKTALTGVELTQTGTVTVDDTRLAKSGITAAQLGENGENGIPNWENLVLGLSCTEKSSIPVVRPVQTADASHVTLKLGGVNIDTKSGATVNYRVHSDSCLVSGALGDVSGWKTPNEVAAMALPGTGVRYYQMEVVTTPGK